MTHEWDQWVERWVRWGFARKKVFEDLPAQRAVSDNFDPESAVRLKSKE